MPFDVSKIKQESHKDYRSAWLNTKKLIPKTSSYDYNQTSGKAHPLHSLIQEVRTIFLELGFSEIENPMFIGEDDVYKQYGPESPVILDRVYYLAGLPRPDIGLSKEKKEKIDEIVEDFDFPGFQNILRRYRSGDIEGDDFLEEMTQNLKVTTDEATQIISLFPEFKNIQPVSSKQTLRSHMTGAWFPTLAALQDELPHPILLFSIGLRFRREQKIDATHLRAHYGGSMVILGDDVSLEYGKKLTEKILEKLDFGQVRFDKKSATSNYYAPETEYEVFSGDIEVADIGMYSPVALSQYDIPYHVFNLGFGLERILMVKQGYKDVRELLYPQFYTSKEFTDQELSKEITFKHSPKTPEGEKIAQQILQTAIENHDKQSPCKVEAYTGNLKNKKISISIIEPEENTQLLGPASLNEIIIHEGSIYGLPEDTSKLKQDVSEIVENGVKPKIKLIEAVAKLLSSKLEQEIDEGKKEGTISVKMVKTPAETNILISPSARKYITSHNKKIFIKGPIFTTIEYKTGK